MMDYATALKKVQARKPKGNFLMVDCGYDTKIVLPHTDGIAFLNSLANAEQLFDPYNAQHFIGPLDRSKITTKFLSQHEYEQYKIAALLGIDIKDVKEMATAIEP